MPAERLRAERPGQVWALDFQYDQTCDGRALRLLNVADEFSREALAMRLVSHGAGERRVLLLCTGSSRRRHFCFGGKQ